MIPRNLQPDQKVPPHDYWEALHAEAFRPVVANLPLMMTQRPDGRLLEHHPPLRLWAKITGRSGSAYSWSEVVNAGSTWTVLTGGRTGTNNAYELNLSTTIPTNAIVELRYSSAGDWRFERVGAGSTGPPPCVTNSAICATFVLCRIGGLNAQPTYKVAGATVNVTRVSDGAAFASGTTDSLGKFCFTATSAGDYRIQSTIPDWDPVDQTITVVCGVDQNLSLVYPPPAGFHCGCCQTKPHPDTLYLTDRYGTWALTWGTSSFGLAGGWGAAITAYESQAGESIVCSSPTSCPDAIVQQAANVPIFYDLVCGTDSSGVTTWSLWKSYYEMWGVNTVCLGGGAGAGPSARLTPGPGMGTTPNHDICLAGSRAEYYVNGPTNVTSACTPISLAFTVAADNTPRGLVINADDSITVSE